MAAKTASLSVNIIADAAKAKAGLKEAESAFGKFSNEVGNAQGAMNKFKVVGGAAFDAIKANAVGFATAAATAIGTFAVKSVMAFQDLALAAGKFADATGLSSQEASRFIEVAGDIGVEAGSVEKAIGFMNKTLGNSPQLFAALGVEVAKTASGATDVNETFLNVVERLNNIQDPAARAAAATKLLGRGWMDMAEMISMGSDGLSKSLASVADAKVIDPTEVARAKELRDNIDQLKDKWEEFSLTVGEKLVPAVSESLERFLALSDAIGKIPVFPDVFGNLLKGHPLPMATMEAILSFGRDLLGTNANVDLSAASFGGLKVGLEQTSKAMDMTSMSTEELNRWIGNQIESVDSAKAGWDEFRNGLTIQQQSLRVQDSIDQFRSKWAGATDEMKLKSREYQQDLLRIQIELSNSSLAIVGLATTAQNTRIRLLIETGQLERAKSLIDAIAAGMNNLAGSVTPDRVERVLGQGAAQLASSSSGNSASPPKSSSSSSSSSSKKKTTTTTTKSSGKLVSTTRLPHMASGGLVTSSGMAVVGENGPELVNLPRGASVIPSIPSRQMMGSGTTINVTVQAGLVSSPDQVGAQIINAIRRAERRSGQVFASII